MPNELKTPTETTTPVNNTTAGLWTFGTPVASFFLNNRTGQTIYVRFNTATAASVAVHDVAMLNGTTLNMKAADLGLDSFEEIGVWMPSGATEANFNIRGA